MAASLCKPYRWFTKDFIKIFTLQEYDIARLSSYCRSCKLKVSKSTKRCSFLTYSSNMHQMYNPVLQGHSTTVRGSNSCLLYVNGPQYDRKTHARRQYSKFYQCERNNSIWFKVCRDISTSSSLLSEGNKDVSSSKSQESSVDGEQEEVKENIKTIPNFLTLGRILCTPVIGYLVVADSFTWALGLFVCAGITDMLDGVIARNWRNQMSALGTALDPLADKILVTVLTITLTTANLLPVPLAVLIIGRDVLLVAAAFYIRFISLPPPRTLSRYFDVTNPTAKLMPSGLSKINTILQLVLVSVTLAAPVFNFVDHPALQALWYITGATTFCSGVGYMWSRNSYVKFLKKDMKRKF